MRVLYIIQTLAKGGSENQISILADRLRGFGHYSSVIALSMGGWWASYLQERDISVSILKFSSGVWPRNMGQFYRLVSALRYQKPDAVISFLYPCSIWASLAAHLAGVPLVIASRRDCGFQRMEAPLPAWLERSSYAATTLFVVNSRAVAQSLHEHEGIRMNKIAIIYNGVDLPEINEFQRSALRLRFGFSESSVVVGMIANFWPHKNHLLLVQAAKHVVARLPQVVFVLAGGYDNYQNEIEAEINREGLRPYFRMIGQLGSASDLLPAIDLCVLCSQREGFSNAILEYMAHGKPVIATRVGGNPEAVADGETGCLVDSYDSAALARAIVGLVRDPEKRKEMGRLGRERVKTNFSWDRASREWDALLRSLRPLAHRFPAFPKDTRPF
jgi:glycosyltransferase involved in cell wall biosynthesis